MQGPGAKLPRLPEAAIDALLSLGNRNHTEVGLDEHHHQDAASMDAVAGSQPRVFTSTPASSHPEQWAATALSNDLAGRLGPALFSSLSRGTKRRFSRAAPLFCTPPPPFRTNRTKIVSLHPRQISRRVVISRSPACGRFTPAACNGKTYGSAVTQNLNFLSPRTDICGHLRTSERLP